jgi:hypothetical protein
MRSRSGKPVGTPVIPVGEDCSRSMCSKVGQRIFAVVALRDLEDPRLGMVEDLLDLALAGLVDVADDLAGRVDQAPHQRLLAHDARVVFDVRRGRHRVYQLREVFEPPRGVELTGLLELFAHRDHVDRASPLEQPHHRAEDAPVPLAEEHRVGHVLDRAQHRVAVDQHAAQHRDLRFQRKGRLAVVTVRRRRRVRQHRRDGFGGVQRWLPREPLSGHP